MKVVLGVKRSGGEALVEFDGDYEPAQAPTRLEPGYPASFEVTGATLLRGTRRRELDAEKLLAKRPGLRDIVDQLAHDADREAGVVEGAGLAEAQEATAREAQLWGPR